MTSRAARLRWARASSSDPSFGGRPSSGRAGPGMTARGRDRPRSAVIPGGRAARAHRSRPIRQRARRGASHAPGSDPLADRHGLREPQHHRVGAAGDGPGSRDAPGVRSAVGRSASCPTGSAQRPVDPDRRRRLRCQQHLRRARADTDARRAGAAGPALQSVQHLRAVRADPGRAADRPQPPPRQHGADHAQAAARLYHRDPAQRGDDPGGPARQRLQHGRLRQMASDAAMGAGRHRPLRPLADGAGLRLFLRLHGIRYGPVASDHRREHPPPRSRRSAGSAIRRRLRRTSPSSSTMRPERPIRRTRPRPTGWRGFAASSIRGGTRSARRASRGRRRWASSPRTPS